MGNDSRRFSITPDAKVGEMLEHYPQLEETLISISPTYKALKNPVLRRTVAKVASLRQVSKVGNVPLGTLIDRLRTAAGQEPLVCEEEMGKVEGERPAWADATIVKQTYDARPAIEAGGHPMPQVMSDLAELQPGEVYALVTPFIPEPLIDLAARKGFRAWSIREEAELVRTYFTK